MLKDVRVLCTTLDKRLISGKYSAIECPYMRAGLAMEGGRLGAGFPRW